MLEGLKPFYNDVLRPFTHVMMKLGLHPNHVTLLGCALFAGAGAASAMGHWYWALVLVIVGAMMDGLDGLLARVSGKKSTFGAILDSSCDRFTEFFLILGVLVFYCTGKVDTLGILLCFTGMSGSIMVSYVKARCEGAGVPCRGGILQRPERIILLSIGLLAGPTVMIWILGGLTLLSFFTTVQRLIIASLYCRQAEINNSLGDQKKEAATI